MSQSSAPRRRKGTWILSRRTGLIRKEKPDLGAREARACVSGRMCVDQQRSRRDDHLYALCWALCRRETEDLTPALEKGGSHPAVTLHPRCSHGDRCPSLGVMGPGGLLIRAEHSKRGCGMSLPGWATGHQRFTCCWCSTLVICEL